VRRQSQVEVTEAARRRLELLRRELSNAGIEPVQPVATHDEPVAPAAVDPVAPVAPAGRHVRRSVAPAARATGWLEDRLPTTLRGRVQLGARELAVLAVVAAVGLVVAAVVVLRSGAGREPVSAPTTPLASTSATAPTTGAPGALVPVAPTGSGTPLAVASGSAAAVTVDVAGRVRRPGVVTLPAGSRVIDALRRAGGPRGHVDLTGLNLARVLTDGEQILVGRAAVGVAASAAGTPGASPGGPLVNLNTATQDQLEQLPGVGPVTAQKILAWRAAHGAFSSVDELLEVDGIGEKTLADLAPYVTL
jgi:competence protein ComEA